MPRPTMKVIFSRKGFDSTSGGAPSPIIDGRPISLPIPTKNYPSETSYSDVGLGEIVEQVTKRRKRRIRASELCHEDPMFANGRWAFGQCGAAQTHLEKNEAGVGDVFLFYGLFSSHDKDPHHRIFGYMKVEEVLLLGTRPSETTLLDRFPRRHPHTIGEWTANNTLYLGSGFKARRAPSILRLTKPGARVSVWNIPPWLKAVGADLPQQVIPLGRRRRTSCRLAWTGICGRYWRTKEPLKWLHDVKAAIRL